MVCKMQSDFCLASFRVIKFIYIYIPKIHIISYGFYFENLVSHGRLLWCGKYSNITKDIKNIL